MNESERILARQNSRANTTASAVRSILYREAVRRVSATVKDAGGRFSGLTALTARAKVRAVLTEDAMRHVIQCHATVAAGEWQGSADNALQRAARRAVRAIGPLLSSMAYLESIRLLVDMAGSHPEHLTPEVAENVKSRVGP